MTAQENRIHTLKLAIEEQRRDHDVVERLYEQAKTKNITFLAAGLALLVYLYGTMPSDSTSLTE